MNWGKKNFWSRAPLGLAVVGVIFYGGVAKAQLASLLSGDGAAPASANNPVTFLADRVGYDKTGNLVTAEGHVRAWQNGQTLYADKVVLYRRTNIAVATGHVILIEPGGQSVYAQQATLSHGLKDAVMQGAAARLALNGRLIANGAQRYNAKVDVLTKAIYSACDLCKTDPTAPPLWQIRATTVTRDLQHRMLEYRNAEMEIYGLPVFYTPYLTEPDPSVKRATGLLIPAAGVSTRLGFFTAIPYYIVLGPSSDVTLTPILATKQGPTLVADYRRAFNSGTLTVDASLGRDRGDTGDSVFANGSFDLNQDWRAGFSYNHASNPAYLDDFHILPNASFLTSSIYLEGFGDGSYARIDAETYQGLVASVNQSELPIVSPHLQYHFQSEADSLGGRFSLDADSFNVLRNLGTQTQRVSAIPGYTLPFAGPLGQLWQARVELVAAAYSASRLYDQPNFSRLDSADTGRAEPYGALFMRWPFIRQGFGNQILEPEMQLVAAPVIGSSQNYRIPNEDSLDLEFSDANLFSLNRYPGIDRLEGGARVDYALHAAWYLPSGALLDGLIGQSYRFHKDNVYLPDSGLTDNASDYVAHLIIQPVPLFNLTYRTRLSHDDLGARLIDATANFGTQTLNLSAGYLYSTTNPYTLYDNPVPGPDYFTPRHEVTANLAANFAGYSLAAGAVRNLTTGGFDSANFDVGWQNDCFGINVVYYKRFTSYNLDHGNTTVLLQLTFKTLGTVGFSAL